MFSPRRVMHPHELALNYPWGDELPAPGRAIAVADGLYWVQLPLPFALNHVNVWLVRDHFEGRDGWTVIDCGVAQDNVQALWEQVFEHVLDGLPIVRVIVTHMHPDHVGLAHWMCDRWQAPLWMSMTDYTIARLWTSTQAGGPTGQTAATFFARHGLSDDRALAYTRERGGYYTHMVPSVPDVFVRLLHGQPIVMGGHTWEVITGYGHAPEHVSFYCDALRILISGDMLLPRISTNISVFPQEPEANPLPLYLKSLDAYQHVADDTLVLPSHGRPFRGAHVRIGQQHAHHAERLATLAAYCTAPRSAADVVPVLFNRELDYHQLGFAMGEAIAHLHALHGDGRLLRLLGNDGVVRWVLANA